MAAALITEFAFHKSDTATADIRDMFSAVASTAGLLAGFMLTAASILASIGDKPFIRSAKRAGVYQSLVDDLFTAMRWGIATTVLSLPAMLYNPGWRLPWYGLAVAFWAFVVFTALGTTVRALRTFTKLMRYVSAD